MVDWVPPQVFFESPKKGPKENFLEETGKWAPLLVWGFLMATFPSFLFWEVSWSPKSVFSCFFWKLSFPTPLKRGPSPFQWASGYQVSKKFLFSCSVPEWFGLFFTEFFCRTGPRTWKFPGLRIPRIFSRPCNGGKAWTPWALGPWVPWILFPPP